MSNNDSQPLGFVCTCGSTAFEVERVGKRIGEVVRRRRCKVCRRDLLTVERPRFPVVPRNSATGSISFDFTSDLRT